MKWKLLVGAALCGMLSIAATYRADQWMLEPVQTSAGFLIYPTDSTVDTSTAPNDTIYMEKANPDTCSPIRVTPWSKVAFRLRVHHDNDSVDCKVYYDRSWDNINWSVQDSTTITDTIAYVAELNSAAAVSGLWIRMRTDPTTGVQQDTVGARPYIIASMISR